MMFLVVGMSGRPPRPLIHVVAKVDDMYEDRFDELLKKLGFRVRRANQLEVRHGLGELKNHLIVVAGLDGEPKKVAVKSYPADYDESEEEGVVYYDLLYAEP